MIVTLSVAGLYADIAVYKLWKISMYDDCCTILLLWAMHSGDDSSSSIRRMLQCTGASCVSALWLVLRL